MIKLAILLIDRRNNMAQQIQKGTVAGLLEYLDMLLLEGKALHGTIKPLISAIRQVFPVVSGGNWLDAKVINLNVDGYIADFAGLTRTQYSDKSIGAYRSRIKRAVEWYNNWLKDDSWTPYFEGVTLLEALKSPYQSIGNTGLQKSPEKIPAPKIETGPSMLTYPFVLRPGKVVQLTLPIDLTLKEAQRLGRYLESLSIDEEAATP
jgi:hypothetical protein